MAPHLVASSDVPRARLDTWDSVPQVLNDNVHFSVVLDEVVDYDEFFEFLVLNNLEVL